MKAIPKNTSRRSICIGLPLVCALPVLSRSNALGATVESASTLSKEGAGGTSVVAAAARKAKEFLDLLDDKKRKKAHFEFEDERRASWHFVPLPQRKGLALNDMSHEQHDAAIELLRTVVSPIGFERATDIMSYEAILLELEGAHRAEVRDYKKFYFVVFGEPSDRGEWGLSIEGHHLSLNLTFVDGVVVDSTPQFFGVNPATLKTPFKAPSVVDQGTEIEYPVGKRLLGAEEDAGFNLLAALDAKQLSQAHYSPNCPADILWGGQPQPKQVEKVGVSASTFNVSQKDLLVELIEAFQIAMPEEIRLGRMAVLKEADLDEISFAWAGGLTKDKQHYFRLHGPTFFVEYCNEQADSAGNTPNHIHIAWRDLTGDFNIPIS